MLFTLPKIAKRTNEILMKFENKSFGYKSFFFLLLFLLNSQVTLTLKSHLDILRSHKMPFSNGQANELELTTKRASEWVSEGMIECARVKKQVIEQASVANASKEANGGGK